MPGEELRRLTGRRPEAPSRPAPLPLAPFLNPRRGMTLSLRPDQLRRYKDVARLLLKHGHADLFASGGLERALLGEEGGERTPVDGDPGELAADLEALGPTFVKLGQLLSTRSDLLPVPYLEALSRLQDHVEPFPSEEVGPLVAEELGVRLSKAFESFDPTPFAAASLGQVHRATLHDGRAVAVKVQRPGIRQVILDDLEAFDALAEIVDRHTEAGRRLAITDLLEEFRRVLLRELDYRREARNLETLADNLEDYPRLVVPRPIADFTTSRVLTMSFIPGTKITELSAMARLDLDATSLAEELAEAYIQGVLVDGFFHADPHPGNILVTQDHRLALIDLGMVARVDPRMRERLLRLVVAITGGRGYEAAQLSLQVGTRLDDFDEDRYTRQVTDLVGDLQDRSITEVNIGRAVLELARRAGQSGLRPAPELASLGKTMLQVNEIGLQLDPEFEPNRIVRRQARSILRHRMLHGASPNRALSSVLEATEFVQELPGRMNRLFDALLRGKLGIDIDVVDERLLMSNLQKIANRIALGLILAALIVGAALMMRVETEFTLLGYPGLAMLLFLAAAACGFMLVFNILYHDYWKEGRSHSPRRRR